MLFATRVPIISPMLVNAARPNHTMEVVLAVVKAANGKSRVSAYVIQEALLSFFTKHRLYPSGIYSEIPACRDWALRNAVAIKKLVS